MFIKIPTNKQMKEKGKSCGHSTSQRENPWFNFHKNMVLDLSLKLKLIISPKNKIKSMLNEIQSI